MYTCPEKYVVMAWDIEGVVMENHAITTKQDDMSEYYVRMVATADTYKYDVISRQADGTYAFFSYTFAQVREMFPHVRNNIDALIALQDHGAEILDKRVDTSRTS